MPLRSTVKIAGPALYFVTTTARNWCPVFKRGAIAVATLLQLGETLKFYDAATQGYVLMHNHLHVLIGIRSSDQLPRIVQGFKSLSSRKIAGLLSQQERAGFMTTRGFRLWTPRYHDVLIASETQFLRKLHYIHENPVRAGLVARAEDWPWSSAGTWLSGRAEPIPVDREFSWT